MPKHPDWLPPIVAEFADTLFRQDISAEVRARLTRLVSSPEMERVWSTLAKHAEPQGLREYIRIAALEYGSFYAQVMLHTPSPAETRRIVHQMAGALDQVRTQLAKLTGKPNNARGGVHSLLLALLRVAKEGASRSSAAQLTQAMELWRQLQTADRNCGIATILEALAKAARLAEDAPALPGPRKRDAKTAARTAYTQLLAAQARQACGKPLYALVATTINVALNEFDHPLTADHVRKLTAKKIIKPKSP